MESRITVCFNYEYICIIKCNIDEIIEILDFIKLNSYRIANNVKKWIMSVFITKNIDIYLAGKSSEIRKTEMKESCYLIDFMYGYTTNNELSYVLADDTGKIIKKSS